MVGSCLSVYIQFILTLSLFTYRRVRDLPERLVVGALLWWSGSCCSGRGRKWWWAGRSSSEQGSALSQDTLLLYYPEDREECNTINILIQCHGNYIMMKKFNYMLKIDVLRNPSQKIVGVLRDDF